MKINWSNWVHPGKIRYAPYEWLCMRLLFGYLMFRCFLHAGYHPFQCWNSPGRGADFMTQPYPRSIAQFMDVTWINQSEHIPMVAGMLGVFLIIYLLGVAPVLSMAGLLFFQVCLGALENSQGNNVWHTTQIVAFAMLGLGGAAFVENLKSLRQGGWAGLRKHWADRYRWLGYALKTPASWWRKGANELEIRQEESRSFSIYIVQQLIAVSYVVAGISKLWISKGLWVIDVQNIGLQFEKNRLLKYYQTLEQPEVVPWATAFVNGHPTLTSWFFSIGLLLELICFVALFNRAFLALFGVGLVVMHLMIAMIMTLVFYYNEAVVGIFFVNVPFWLVWGWQRLTGRRKVAG